MPRGKRTVFAGTWPSTQASTMLTHVQDLVICGHDRGEVGLAYLHPEANERPDAVAWHMRVPLADRIGMEGLTGALQNLKDNKGSVARQVVVFD